MLSQIDLYGNLAINILSLQREIAKMNIMLERDTEKVFRIAKSDIEDIVTILNEELNGSFLKRMFKGFSKKEKEQKEKNMGTLLNLINLINNHNSLVADKIRMEVELGEKSEELVELEERAVEEQEINCLNEMKVNNGITISSIINNLEIKSKVVPEDTQVTMLNEDFAKIGFLYINELMPNGAYEIKENAIKHLFHEIVRQYNSEAKINVKTDISIKDKTVLEVLSENLQYDLSMSILDSVKTVVMSEGVLTYSKLFSTTGWEQPFKDDGFSYNQETGEIEAATTAAISVIQLEVCDRMEDLDRKIIKACEISKESRKDLFLLTEEDYTNKYGVHTEFSVDELKKYILLSKGVSEIKVMVSIEREEMNQEVEAIA